MGEHIPSPDSESESSGKMAMNERGRAIDEWRRLTPFILDGAQTWLCGPVASLKQDNFHPQAVLVSRERLNSFGGSPNGEEETGFFLMRAVKAEHDWALRLSDPAGKKKPKERFSLTPAQAVFVVLLDCAREADLMPVIGLYKLEEKEAVALAGQKGWCRLSAQHIEKSADISKTVYMLSRAHIPVEGGEAELILFRSQCGTRCHMGMIFGKLESETIPVRLHSACLTGDTFGSLRCDCGIQLEQAIKRLTKEGGILLYMDQEGRGIGLSAKLKAYQLQDQAGLDTVQANQYQGYSEDARTYEEAAHILNILGANHIELMTNNPAKIEALEAQGIRVAKRLPHYFPENIHNRDYMAIKKKKMGHHF